MAMRLKPDASIGVLDKKQLQQSVIALQARLGLNHDSSATGEQSQAITLAAGLRPEDRVLSGEVLRMRRQEKE
jgi:hypothetical protein